MDDMGTYRRRLEALRAELDELKGSIPAHSTSVHHIARMEELEEQIEELEQRVMDM